MGRAPCCDKMLVKKGPWTPEEDIMLVSYIQRHGPGNWRQIPTNTGLRRCSKSCRLRWTNYLRPGIKRGDFTHDEETIIIQLQALLGNKWSAIASYLPERTDNDIKNHWNTHLKNKLRKLYDHHHHHHAYDHPSSTTSTSSSSSSSSYSYRGQWEKRLQTDVHMAKQALNDALSLDKPKPFIFLDNNNYNFPPPPHDQTTTTTTSYACSTNNIAKLLKGFMKPTSDSIGSSSQGFESLLFGFDDQSFGSPNGSDLSLSNMSPMESKPLPFTMFEDWLLDDEEGGDDVITQRKTDLTSILFDQNPDYFFN